MLAAQMIRFATALTALAATMGAASADEAIRRATQVFLAHDGSTVERREVAVIDPEPELGRDFTWSPEPGASPVDEDGFASGRGVLTWRVGGAPDYDRKAVLERYEGEMRAGRPEGQGVLTSIAGEVHDGAWEVGLPDGQGLHIDADGNRYSGVFSSGALEGAGTIRFANGDLFVGNFRKGLREGAGRMALAGGGGYRGEWANDKFTGAIPETGPDGLVSGVQSSKAGASGDAARTKFGIDIDRRVTMQDPGFQYTSEAGDQGLVIRPAIESVWRRWNGKQGIRIEPGWYFDKDGWDFFDTSVWLSGEVVSTDGKPFSIESVFVEVKSSAVFRKPLFALDNPFGCKGFRPNLSLLNSGYGSAKRAVFEFAFTSRDGKSKSRTFRQDLGKIGGGSTVDLRPELEALGVDVKELAETRLFCAGEADCTADVAAHMPLGDLRDLAYLADGEIDASFGSTGIVKGMHVVVGLEGRITYQWSGDGGSTFEESEVVRTYVPLGAIKSEDPIAECGAYGGSPEAPMFKTIELHDRGKDYAFEAPVRGDKQTTRHKVHIRLVAPRHSVHDLVIGVRFADGSVRKSKPLFVKYFRIAERSDVLDGSNAVPNPDKGCYLTTYASCY